MSTEGKPLKQESVIIQEEFKGTDTDFIVEMFLQEHAVSEKQAIELESFEFDLEPYKKAILKLLEDKYLILVPGDEEKYYLDYETYAETAEVEHKKRRFITLVSIIIPSALLFLLGLAWIITI